VWEPGQEIVVIRGDVGSLGGSLAARTLDLEPGKPWSPLWDLEVSMGRGLLRARERGLLSACRDISDGGLLLTLLELLFHEESEPRVGIRLTEDIHEGHDPVLWFLAEGTGYVASAPAGRGDDLVCLLGEEGAPALMVGFVTEERDVVLPMRPPHSPVRIDPSRVWRCWRGCLQEVLA
jgi:phosphoribosylformylglycinamidine (FGAM) synthase-like enzyme